MPSLNSITVPTTTWVMVENVINLCVYHPDFFFFQNPARKVWDGAIWLPALQANDEKEY